MAIDFSGVRVIVNGEPVDASVLNRPVLDLISTLEATLEVGNTPAGAVMAFAGNTPPEGWIKANGAAVSRTAYAALFAAIGTTFGAGNGSTTFNVPDLRGEFVRGWDDARGIDAARSFGSFQGDRNAAHNHTASSTSDSHAHTFSASSSSGGSHAHTVGVNMGVWGGYGGTPWGCNGGVDTNTWVSWAGDHTHTVSGSTSIHSHSHTITVNASGDTEARPRNLALLYCIKF